MRKSEEIIKDIKKLVSAKGYIYALCMILFEDLHVNAEQLHETNFQKRISVKEASLILGFLVQSEMNFEQPNDSETLISFRKKTYELMEELHFSFMSRFFEKMDTEIKEKKKYKFEDYRKHQKDFFGTGDMLIEPIFYSGDGVYDFQYTEFLEKKYKYDVDWLFKEKKFNSWKIKGILDKIKDILQKKGHKVHLKGLKENLPAKIRKLTKEKPDEDWNKHAEEILPILELYQFVELFEYSGSQKEGWNNFYRNIIDLFTIKKSDFVNSEDIDSFLSNFSFQPTGLTNTQFQFVGNYNIVNSHPIIQLDDETYFIPILFLLYQAVYESPFYWMINDSKYLDNASKNRGNVGEELAYEQLSKVFDKANIFKSVKIKSSKGTDVTDIDVLCILGNKALCVQVKSKSLTLLSRQGDDFQLQKDFKAAIQDAYKQGLDTRNEILSKSSTLLTSNGDVLKISEEIDDVYIMCITTENYPSITHQTHILLTKEEADPFPITLTIFDLELLTHYLNDPYDFLYYIKQRTTLMEYFKADEEMSYLGYHLDRKLWKSPNTIFASIDRSFAQSIDRNYYPIKAKIKVSTKGDILNNRWKNEKFDELCSELKKVDAPKITDIIFHLFDQSGSGREIIVNLIKQSKQKTFNDKRNHNFSLPPDPQYPMNPGFSYFSINTGNISDLKNQLLSYCKLRKYKSKAKTWIGFGSLINSTNMIDAVCFFDENWKYDNKMERLVNENLGQGQFRVFKKVGRNERCICGSGIKYKYCCGKNI